MIEISSIWVVCEFCGTANKFDNQFCSNCKGILRIELQIETEKSFRESFIERKLAEDKAKRQQEITMSLLDSIRPRNKANYGIIGITLTVFFIIILFPTIQMIPTSNIPTSNMFSEITTIIISMLPIIIILAIAIKIRKVI